MWCWACVLPNTMPVPPLWAEVTSNPPNLIIFILKVYHMFGVCGSVGQYTSVKSNNPLVCHNLPGKCEKYSFLLWNVLSLISVCLFTYNIQFESVDVTTSYCLQTPLSNHTWLILCSVACSYSNLIECMEGLFYWHSFVISISKDEDMFKNTAKWNIPCTTILDVYCYFC